MRAARRPLPAVSGEPVPRGLIDRLKLAEQEVRKARRDFLRLRNAVDSAGELSLWEQLDSAERELQDAIRRLDAMVYPAEKVSGSD